MKVGKDAYTEQIRGSNFKYSQNQVKKFKCIYHFSLFHHIDLKLCANLLDKISKSQIRYLTWHNDATLKVLH